MNLSTLVCATVTPTVVAHRGDGADVQAVWDAAFTSDDPESGGCPAIGPATPGVAAGVAERAAGLKLQRGRPQLLETVLRKKLKTDDAALWQPEAEGVVGLPSYPTLPTLTQVQKEVHGRAAAISATAAPAARRTVGKNFCYGSCRRCCEASTDQSRRVVRAHGPRLC
jgi:hypothetical protein